jgi:hypothetical protein
VAFQPFVENIFSRIRRTLSKDKIQTVGLSPRRAASFRCAVDDDQGLAHTASLANVTSCILYKPIIPSRLGLMDTPSHLTTGEIGCGGRNVASVWVVVSFRATRTSWPISSFSGSGSQGKGSDRAPPQRHEQGRRILLGLSPTP